MSHGSFCEQSGFSRPRVCCGSVRNGLCPNATSGAVVEPGVLGLGSISRSFGESRYPAKYKVPSTQSSIVDHSARGTERGGAIEDRDKQRRAPTARVQSESCSELVLVSRPRAGWPRLVALGCQVLLAVLLRSSDNRDLLHHLQLHARIDEGVCLLRVIREEPDFGQP